VRERNNGYRKDDKEDSNLNDRAQDNGDKVANALDHSQLKQLFVPKSTMHRLNTVASIAQLPPESESR